MSPLLTTAWVWQPVSSPLHIVGGAFVLACLAVFAYVRTMSGKPIASSLLLAMRLALVVSLAVLLMGPSRIPPEKRDANRPRLIMLLDTSESMQIVDCGSQSRIRYAVERLLNPRQINRLGQDYRVELHAFDEKSRPFSLELLREPDATIAAGKATFLNDSITSVLSQISTKEEGTVLCVMSDGRDSQDAPIQPAASLAKSRKIPVFTIGLGGESLQRDATLLAVPMQEYLLPGEPGAILVKIYQSGMGEAATTLKVSQAGKVESIPVSFNHKSVVELQIPIRKDDEGHYEYQVSIDPVDGEKETANNNQVVFCDVVKKRIRILMLEGRPFWDSKFLAQSLRKDDRVELTQITQLSTKKKETIVTRVEDGTPKVPTTQEDWDRYDVVILGQAIENLLTRDGISQLKTFVSDHGGHLIFSRGQACTANSAAGGELAAELGVLEPVVWGTGQLQKVSLALTPSGRTSPWFATTKMNVNVDDAFSRLPGFDAMPVIEREKPATIVLARASLAGAANAGGETYPAIVRMNYGRGIVVALLGEGLWQWSLLSPERQDLVGFYDTFWSNLVRWLSMGGDFPPGQQVALQLDRTSVRLGSGLLADVVYKRAGTGAAPPNLTLTLPSGDQQTIAMAPVPGRESRYRAQVDPQSVGIFQLALHTPDAEPAKIERKFSVYDINLERLNASANPLPLRILADHSGGEFLDTKAAEDLADHLHRQRASMVVPPKLEYIWDQGFVMVLLLMWAGVEWLIRRLVGLL